MLGKVIFVLLGVFVLPLKSSACAFAPPASVNGKSGSHAYVRNNKEGTIDILSSAFPWAPILWSAKLTDFNAHQSKVHISPDGSILIHIRGNDTTRRLGESALEIIKQHGTSKQFNASEFVVNFLTMEDLNRLNGTNYGHSSLTPFSYWFKEITSISDQEFVFKTSENNDIRINLDTYTIERRTKDQK